MLSHQELQAQSLDVLPGRHTMGLIAIGDVKLLEDVRLLKGNSIGVIVNVLSFGNENEQD
jgi:hypothetical protein